MQIQQRRHATGVGRDLICAAAGLLAMLISASALEAAIRSGAIADPVVQTALSYAAVWIPLVAAVAVACAGTGWAESRSRLGLRFQLLDFPWGVAGGLSGRAVDAFSRIQLTGSSGLVPQALFSAPTMTPWVILSGVVAPVIVGPVVEEVFFRGLLQRSLAGALGGSHRLRGNVAAICATSVVFAAAHVLLAGTTGTDAVAVAIGTFAFSIIAGTLTAATGRIGGSIVAHVVFNGVAVLMVGPW